MKFPAFISHWVEIRPGEGRIVSLAVAGAFCVVAYLTGGRSVREAAFIGHFGIRNLPYATAAVAFLGVPLAILAGSVLQKYSSLRILKTLLFIQIAGLALLWLLLDNSIHRGICIVFIYFWIAHGALLTAAVFWVLVADSFFLRGAKRLFGLISAGGTLGGLMAGFLLRWAVSYITDPLVLLPVLAGILACLVLLLWGWPVRVRNRNQYSITRQQDSDRYGLGEIMSDNHLRLIALMIMTATVASTLLDYIFKAAAYEATAGTIQANADLAGVLGSFYGWTGAAALLIQLVVTGRLMQRLEIGFVLLILPVLLVTGAAGVLAVPSLLVAIFVRGGDAVLRKSIFRPAIEILYLPVADALRRRARAVVDTALDGIAEGFGAIVVFGVVTLAGAPARNLAPLVILAGTLLIWMGQKMSRRYVRTVSGRLQGDAESVLNRFPDGDRPDNLLSAGFSRLNLNSILDTVQIQGQGGKPKQTKGDTILLALQSPHAEIVLDALNQVDVRSINHMETVVRLLANPKFAAPVADVLKRNANDAMPAMLSALMAEGSAFAVRRRISRLLATIGGVEADAALLDLLEDRRFDLRFRAAVALVLRIKCGLPTANRNRNEKIWAAVRREISQSRVSWELRKIDGEIGDDDGLFAGGTNGVGSQSLQHTFRLLSLVLAPEPIRAAYHALTLDDPKLRDLALEYLEQALPGDIGQDLLRLLDVPRIKKSGEDHRDLATVITELTTSNQAYSHKQNEMQNPVRKPPDIDN